MPTPTDVRAAQDLYNEVFSSPQGRELIELWIETVVLANPRSTDPNECIAFTAKCAFIEDIVKALDKANNPAKYAEFQHPPTLGSFDPRKRVA